jgi:dihydrofolate reductase
MSTVTISNILSLDGFTADEQGNPLALAMDAAFDAINLEHIEAADAVLLGRTSFEMFSSYWPHIAGAPAEAGNRALDDVNRAISRRYNAVPKVVVSDTLTVPADNPWADTTTIVARRDIAARLKAAKENYVVFGSRITWNGLLAAGLVDELHLMISPGALGRGTPAFATTTPLTMLGARTFTDSGNVLLRYTPAG